MQDPHRIRRDDAGRSAGRAHGGFGQTSAFSYITITERVVSETTVTRIGSVTSGVFAGAAVIEQFVFPNPNPLLCLTEDGVERIDGLVTVDILGL